MEENNENKDSKDYDLIINYVSSKMKYQDPSKDSHKIGSLKLTNRKIYDICQSKNTTNIDNLINYINDHEEKGVLDYLINTINKNPLFLDKSFFYLNQLITMLTYKK